VRAAVLAAPRVRRASVKASWRVGSLPRDEASGVLADVGGGRRFSGVERSGGGVATCVHTPRMCGGLPSAALVSMGALLGDNRGHVPLSAPAGGRVALGGAAATPWWSLQHSRRQQQRRRRGRWGRGARSAAAARWSTSRTMTIARASREWPAVGGHRCGGRRGCRQRRTQVSYDGLLVGGGALTDVTPLQLPPCSPSLLRFEREDKTALAVVAAAAGVTWRAARSATWGSPSCPPVRGSPPARLPTPTKTPRRRRRARRRRAHFLGGGGSGRRCRLGCRRLSCSRRGRGLGDWALAATPPAACRCRRRRGRR